MGSWFCDRPRLNFLAFAWRGIYMTAKRAVTFVKKVTYFGEFGYLNSSCIRKSIILLFLCSSRDKFTLLQQNSVTYVFVDFQPPSGWCPCRLAWQASEGEVKGKDERAHFDFPPSLSTACRTGYVDGHQHDVSIQISINLDKTFLPISRRKKNCCDLNLGRSLCIITFFLFPDSGPGCSKAG